MARYVMLACLPFFGILLYYSKVQDLRVLLSNVYIGICSLVALVLSMFSGGVNSEVLPWFAIIPLLALLLHDKKYVIIWSIVCLIEMTLLFFTDKWVEESSFLFDGKKILGLNYILNLSLIFLITVFVLIIERSQMKAQKELKNTVVNLQSAEEELRQSMEELTATQEVLSITNQQLNLKVDTLNKANHELNVSRLAMSQKNEKLELYASKLLMLTKNEFIQSGDLENSLKLILSEAHKSLVVSRVSIWLFINKNHALFCKLLYDKSNNEFVSGQILNYIDYPVYFDRIKSNQPLVVNDVYTNSYTQEFNDTYSKLFQITSLLDVPLFVNGLEKGVLCFENQNVIKEWSDEDVLFAKSIADLVAISFQSNERSMNNRLLQNQKEEIVIKNKELENLTEELKAMNEMLEHRVQERTEQLEVQNKNLAEYTFINVHLLRAPLCRVLGLSELLKYSTTDQEILELIHMLDAESKDLEKLISKVTRVLESGAVIDRKQI
jgi:GAF domain-containing protein